MRVSPPPNEWAFPPVHTADPDGFCGVGADHAPGTLLAAYRLGLFPMPTVAGGPMSWWSPDPRGILPLDGLRVTRSLRQSIRHYEVRVDTAFAEVVAACGDPTRPNGWIDEQITEAYTALHHLGWAHSVETWTPGPDGRLVGGLYGVSIGGFFAGESMFHHARDASKVALWGLVTLLVDGGATLLDVQWTTDHLRTLGAVDVPRAEYLEQLAAAVDLDVDPFDPAPFLPVRPGPAADRPSVTPGI